MKQIILFLASLVNDIHDLITQRFGVQLSDKDLHFWVIGLIGMGLFLVVYLVFKWIETFKFKTTILAFIYTYTLMVVLVFAIEIQQAITNRGNMEFADAAMGLWGFLVFFFFYAVVVGILYGMIRAVKKTRKKEPFKTEVKVKEEPVKRFRSEKTKK